MLGMSAFRRIHHSAVPGLSSTVKPHLSRSVCAHTVAELGKSFKTDLRRGGNGYEDQWDEEEYHDPDDDLSEEFLGLVDLLGIAQ